jgi:antitoxin MazE
MLAQGRPCTNHFSLIQGRVRYTIVIPMKVVLHRIGNSQGVILPKLLLAQVGFTEGEIEMTVEREAIVLRKPKKSVRSGWADAAQKLSKTGDDNLVWPEFPNEGDEALTW